MRRRIFSVKWKKSRLFLRALCWAEVWNVSCSSRVCVHTAALSWNQHQRRSKVNAPNTFLVRTSSIRRWKISFYIDLLRQKPFGCFPSFSRWKEPTSLRTYTKVVELPSCWLRSNIHVCPWGVYLHIKWEERCDYKWPLKTHMGAE